MRWYIEVSFRASASLSLPLSLSLIREREEDPPWCKTRDRRHLAQMHTPTEGGASPQGSLSLSLSSRQPLSLSLPPWREREREREKEESIAGGRCSSRCSSLAAINLIPRCSFHLSLLPLPNRALLGSPPSSSPRRCHDSTAYRLRGFFFLLKRRGQPRWIRLSDTLSIVEFSILQREESFFFLNLNGMNLEVFGEMFPYLLILFRREKKLSKKRKLDILLQGIIRKIEK